LTKHCEVAQTLDSPEDSDEQEKLADDEGNFTEKVFVGDCGRSVHIPPGFIDYLKDDIAPPLPLPDHRQGR